MDKEKNLEELLLAIGGGGSAPNAANPSINVSLPVPTSTPIAVSAVPIPPPQIPPVPNANQGASPSGDQNKYFTELVNLLGTSASPNNSARFPQQTTAIPPAAINRPNHARNIPVTAQAAQKPAIHPTHVIGAPNRPAPATPSRTASVAGAAAAAAANATARRPNSTMDITAELTAVMSSNSSGLKPKTPRPTSTNSSRGGRGGMTTGSNGGPNRSQQRAHQHITQEQIIVGHFCRHAIKTLSRVMQGKEEQPQTEARLKEHIKSIWAQWVRGTIPKQRLLESVANFVRSSCPEARSIDVIRDFKTWYEREFENQRRRSLESANLDPQERARRLQMQSAMQKRQVQAQAARRNPNGVATNASAMVATTAAKTAAARTGPMKQVKTEPSISPIRTTGGKSIGSKTVPARPVATKAAKAAAVAAAVAKGSVKNVAGKSVASKSVGGKSISRPPMVANKSTAGSKAPAGMHNVPMVNKTMAAAKSKAPRKPAAKVSPKPPQVKQKIPLPPGARSPSNTFNPGIGMVPATVNGKRPLDNPAVAPPGPAAKKAKPAVKVQKPTVGRKKTPMVTAGAPFVKPVVKPTVPQTAVPKGRPVKIGLPNTVNGGSNMGTPMAAKVAPPFGAAAPGQPVAKKISRVDDELNVVNNIVDIDNEVDILDRDAGGGEQEVVEVIDFSADMLLSGPALLSKMQAITRQSGLEEKVSKDTMEMMSLAVRERLACMMESLRDIAAARLESKRGLWKTHVLAPNLFEKMQQMRQDEERLLTVAAETRVRMKKEHAEHEAKKLAGEAGADEKKSKDASAAADSERKEKLALEKKRKEHSSQRDALSGLLAGIDKRRKKPTSLKGLAPLGPLKSGGSQTSLPPIVRKTGTLSPVVKRVQDHRLGGKGLKPLSPVVRRTIHGKPKAEVLAAAEKAKAAAVKLPITLRDCLFFMESEVNTRKSSLLYKWYARLGTQR